MGAPAELPSVGGGVGAVHQQGNSCPQRLPTRFVPLRIVEGPVLLGRRGRRGSARGVVVPRGLRGNGSARGRLDGHDASGVTERGHRHERRHDATAAVLDHGVALQRHAGATGRDRQRGRGASVVRVGGADRGNVQLLMAAVEQPQRDVLGSEGVQQPGHGRLRRLIDRRFECVPGQLGDDFASGWTHGWASCSSSPLARASVKALAPASNASRWDADMRSVTRASACPARVRRAPRRRPG